MNPLTGSEVALRITIAFAIGVILGYEREQHGRAAGMRTTMLVCVSAAIAMVLSEHLFWAAGMESGAWRPDPARLAAGVLAGMGFLGAGVIMRQEQAIHGVTTAALLWFSAILGLAIGSGYLLLGFAGFLIAFIALFFLPGVESFIQADRYAVLDVDSVFPGPSQDKVKQLVESMGLGATLKPTGLEHDKDRKRMRMHFEVKVKKGRIALCQARAVEAVGALPGVRKVTWA